MRALLSRGECTGGHGRAPQRKQPRLCLQGRHLCFVTVAAFLRMNHCCTCQNVHKRVCIHSLATQDESQDDPTVAPATDTRSLRTCPRRSAAGSDRRPSRPVRRWHAHAPQHGGAWKLHFQTLSLKPGCRLCWAAVAVTHRLQRPRRAAVAALMWTAAAGTRPAAAASPAGTSHRREVTCGWLES